MNHDNKRMLVAAVLCVVFYLIYTNYLQTKYPDMYTPPEQRDVASQVDQQKSTTQDSNVAVKENATDGGQTEAVLSESAGSEAPKKIEKIKRLSSQDLVIENDDVIYRFSQNNSSIRSIELKHYSAEATNRGKNVELVDSQLLIQALSDVRNTKGETGYRAERSGNTISFWKQLGAWELKQTFQIPEKGYAANVTFEWKNISQNPAELNASILMQENPNLAEEESGGFLPGMPTERSMAIGIVGDNETEREDIKSYCTDLADGDLEPAVTVQNAPLHVLGIDKHYFLKALLPKGERLGYTMTYAGKPSVAQCEFALMAWQPQGLVTPNQTVSLKFDAWFGPKDIDLMDAHAPKLSQTVDFGWFSFISVPLLQAVKFCYGFTGNWGLAIILVTVLLKLVFYPLSKQAAVSAHKMKQLQPELKKLQEKFKDDRMALQQAMMKFYSDHKVNPMKGCLPILPQLPVFFAFFRMLSGSIELRHAPFFGWIQDLSAADPYYITPILLGVTYFLQQKMMPTPGMDKTSQNVMLMMPVIFSVMMITFPSGLVLYSLVNTVVTIAQQVWINRKLDGAAPALAKSAG